MIGVGQGTGRSARGDPVGAEPNLTEDLLREAERRATRLQTAAEIARAATSQLNLEELLPQSVELIRERFELYYVGLFLLDERREWAVLRAGSGETGRNMLVAHHRLRSGGDSMIGQCVATAEPRIALDVADAVDRFPNPLLPDTKAEMALPLVSRDRVLGAMTVQSDVADAFSNEDITILLTMADQLANAIQNALLIERMNQAVRETELLYNVSSRIGDAESIEDLLEAAVEVAAFLKMDSVVLLTPVLWNGGALPLTADIYELSVRSEPPVLSQRANVATDRTRHAWYFEQTNQIAVVSNLDEPCELPQVVVSELRERGARSLIAGRLGAGDRSQGILELTGIETLDGIPDRVIQIFARTLLDQIAPALERHVLLRELDHKAAYLQQAADVSRVTSSYLDRQQLLDETTLLMRDRFDLGCVKIYLVDDSGKWAVLQADSSRGERSSQSSRERVALENDARAPSRIAQCIVQGDVVQGAIEPGPDRRREHGFEAVFPLISRGITIGAVVIALSGARRLSGDDIATFATLTGQLANAIVNAQLYEESQAHLDELQRLQQRYAMDMWGDYVQQRDAVGYRYDLQELAPLEATDEGLTVPDQVQEGAALVQPFGIRGESVGLMSFEATDGSMVWSEEDKSVLEAVREQLELALENRLLIDRSQRALQEARQHESELGFLQEVSTLLNATNDVVAGRSELLLLFRGFLPVTRLILIGLDRHSGALTRLGQARAAGSYGTEGFGLAGSAFDWVTTHQTVAVVDDLRTGAQFPEDDHLAKSGILSRAILPLMLGERILGALELDSDQAGIFDRAGLVSILRQVASQVASAMERGNLLRVAQSNAEESRRLYEVTSDLAEASDAGDILDAIALHVFPVAAAGAEIGLFVVDPETGEEHEWVEIVAVRSPGQGPSGGGSTAHSLGLGRRTPDATDQVRLGARLRASELPALALLGDDQMAIYQDIAADLGTRPDLREHYLSQGVRALVILALSTGAGTYDRLGLLQIRFSSPYRVEEEDRRLYRTISEQAAVVLSNRQLFQESQSRIMRQAVAVELANLTTSFSEREPLLQTAVDYLRDRFDLYFAGIFLTDDLAQWAVLQAGSGEVGERLMLMGHRVLVDGDTMVARCIQGRARILVSDIDRIQALRENPLLPETQSAVAFPLISRGQVIGVITLQSTERFAFAQEDLGALELMVNQLANVIESANLYERSQASLAETRMLYRIAQQITDARDAEDVLRVAVEGISQRAEPDWVVAGLLEPSDAPTVLRITVSWNREGLRFPRDSIPLNSIRLVYDVLHTDERFVTPNITQDPMVDDLLRRIYGDLGVRATAAFQLSVRSQQYGTILVHSQNAREFSTAELSFYENVARQAFVALENISLVDATREQAERRDILNEVLQTASSSLDRTQILEGVSQVIARRLEMPVLVWSWNGLTALPVAVHDAGGAALTSGGQHFRLEGQAMARIRSAVQSHEPTDLAFGSQSPLTGLRQNLDTALVDGYAVPLIARDVVHGVIALGRQLGHDGIGELEREFMQTVGTSVAVALETASLYLDAQETAEKLKEVDALKNQFMANMSHELRTPLNSIIGFSRVMLKGIDGPLTEMQETDLGAIYDSGRHLLNLINDILDISKINAGKMEVAFEPVVLGEMIRSVMSTAMGFVKDKPVKLLTDVPEDLPKIVADSRRIRQVLTNLLGNAGKFTDEGFIKVSVTSDHYQVIVSVQDTGVGIPPDRIHAVFEQFEQVDSSSSRRYQGTGLGVPLSREFVRMHGGDMWIQESRPGEGTTFCFSLPIGGPDSVEGRPIGDAAQNRVVLTVDDDERVITLFRRYLERHGYTVFGLTRGERVIEEATRLKPYAITLDVLIPDRDGWLIIQELKSNPRTRDIPIIICSVLGEEDRGISMGITDYLLKPISESSLLEALAHLGDGGDGQVLVVDDNPDDRQLLRRILEDAGHQVLEAPGGAEAIRQIEQALPSLVVLDLMMPDIDGFAVLEQLKRDEATRRIPVVVVTAKELTMDERSRLQHRVEALLEKGLFDQQQLLSDVAAALDRAGSSRFP